MRFWPSITQELFNTESAARIGERLTLRLHRAPTGWNGWRELFVPRVYWKGAADETAFRMTFYKRHRPSITCRGEFIPVPDGTRILVHWELTPAAKVLLGGFILFFLVMGPLAIVSQHLSVPPEAEPQSLVEMLPVMLFGPLSLWAFSWIAVRIGYWQARASLLRSLGIPQPKPQGVQWPATTRFVLGCAAAESVTPRREDAKKAKGKQARATDGTEEHG